MGWPTARRAVKGARESRTRAPVACDTLVFSIPVCPRTPATAGVGPASCEDRETAGSKSSLRALRTLREPGFLCTLRRWGSQDEFDLISRAETAEGAEKNEGWPTALRAVKGAQESRTRAHLTATRSCSPFPCALERRPRPALGQPRAKIARPQAGTILCALCGLCASPVFSAPSARWGSQDGLASSLARSPRTRRRTRAGRSRFARCPRTPATAGVEPASREDC